MSLEDGMDLSGMSYDQLWVRQVAIGGDLGALEVEAYVLGLLPADAHHHNLIAQALSEHFLDRGEGPSRRLPHLTGAQPLRGPGLG